MSGDLKYGDCVTFGNDPARCEVIRLVDGDLVEYRHLPSGKRLTRSVREIKFGPRDRLPIPVAVAQLAACGTDPEVSHCEADDIVADAMDPALAAAYRAARERAGGWWYA